MSGAIDPTDGIMIAVGSGFFNEVNLQTGAVTSPTTSGDQTVLNGNAPGIAWDSAINQFVGWNGGSTLYTLDLSTSTWTAHAAAAGSAVPTAATANGTFGRFQYDAVDNTFVVVNDINQDVYVFNGNVTGSGSGGSGSGAGSGSGSSGGSGAGSGSGSGAGAGSGGVTGSGSGSGAGGGTGGGTGGGSGSGGGYTPPPNPTPTYQAPGQGDYHAPPSYGHHLFVEHFADVLLQLVTAQANAPAPPAMSPLLPASSHSPLMFANLMAGAASHTTADHGALAQASDAAAAVTLDHVLPTAGSHTDIVFH